MNAKFKINDKVTFQKQNYVGRVTNVNYEYEEENYFYSVLWKDGRGSYTGEYDLSLIEDPNNLIKGLL